MAPSKATVSESPLPKIGNKAPAFTLQDQNGDKHSLKDTRAVWWSYISIPKP